MCGHKPVLSMKKSTGPVFLQSDNTEVKTHNLPHFTIRGGVVGSIAPVAGSTDVEVLAVFNEAGFNEAGERDYSVWIQKLKSIGTAPSNEAAKKMITDHFVSGGHCARYKAPKIAA